MASTINYAALSAEQMEEMLMNLKQEMVDRTAKAKYAAAQERRRAAAATLREWHAELAEVKAEKNAELVAAGKQRINAIHIAYFLSWHRRHYWDISHVTTFPVWFGAHPHLFRDVKPQLPKLNPADLPVAERLRRLINAAKHINERVVDLTAKVAAQTESLAAAEAAKQQLLIKEHTLQDIQVADYDIETAQYYLNKTNDLLERAKTSQRKFAEKHC